MKQRKLSNLRAFDYLLWLLIFLLYSTSSIVKRNVQGKSSNCRKVFTPVYIYICTRALLYSTLLRLLFVYDLLPAGELLLCCSQNFPTFLSFLLSPPRLLFLLTLSATLPSLLPLVSCTLIVDSATIFFFDFTSIYVISIMDDLCFCLLVSAAAIETLVTEE